jgi:FKBP-type peptidyl-prolyl cis-trans isomerase
MGGDFSVPGGIPFIFPERLIKRVVMSYRVLLCLAALIVVQGCNTKKEPPKAPPPSAAPATPPAPPPQPGAIPAPPDVKEAPADAEKTPSGLASKVITKGTGTEHPKATDAVEVHYTGWKTNGEMFDSSVVRHEPAKFPLNGVIKGWTEGLQLMVQGEKRRFWIPANLAYGDNPGGGRPGGTLVFDVELLGIRKTPPPPETPPDVAAVPKNAKKTKSGLAYRVLKKGKGSKHPTTQSTVEIHYTGWTPDGKIVDSSVMRGEPATVPLGGHLPAGWVEGVQLMVEGEKTRFWMPSNLVEIPGKPPGMLVFDIELLAVK